MAMINQNIDLETRGQILRVFLIIAAKIDK